MNILIIFVKDSPMPEGPEVKTICQNLHESLHDKTLGALWHSDFCLRKPFKTLDLKLRENKKIDKVSSYGKVIFIYSQNKPILMVQLGMTGQLKVQSKEMPIMPHTHVRWELKKSPNELRYVDQRRFGLFDICDEDIKDKIIKNLGQDIFDIKNEQIKSLILNMKKSSRAIKDVLLDQKIICGVGNIYASESLFLAKINPKKRASEIDEKKYHELIDAIIATLNLALKNGGTTFSDYVDGHGQKGQNQKNLKVFQRENEPCFSCGHMILRIKLCGRSTFYCERCQKF